METPLIRYNLKDRGRKHTGKSRNFDIRAIADAINSPATQEMVASRGMAGYYGHVPRIRYGMIPPEGTVEQGKYSPVEPAFVTTFLRADYDGNVEHRAEFLDNASGAAAEKLWKSKFGGFSSAIDESKPSFFGFDYVNQPNYLGNSFRGIALDDAFSGEVGELTYDDIYAAEQEEQANVVVLLLDNLSAERDMLNGTIERLQVENEQLLSMLSRKGVSATAALDSTFESGVVVSVEPMARMRRDRAFFMNDPLHFAKAPPAKEVEFDTTSQRMIDRATR